VPAGDLFALANAVASLISAPVTIEDRSSRVLAFSGRQDEADPSRVETILGRKVPVRYTRMLEERGVFQRLYRSDQAVYIEGLLADDGSLCLPRLAVAVRAGDEFLGSIWAAVRGPLSPDRSAAFGDAAKLVALHMMRQRAGADVERRLRADLVSTAVEGGQGAAEAVRRLGLADQACVVLALALAHSHGDDPAAHARLLAERQQVADGVDRRRRLRDPARRVGGPGAADRHGLPQPHRAPGAGGRRRGVRRPDAVAVAGRCRSRAAGVAGRAGRTSGGTSVRCAQ
jgi:hypothetical protein